MEEGVRGKDLFYINGDRFVTAGQKFKYGEKELVTPAESNNEGILCKNDINNSVQSSVSFGLKNLKKIMAIPINVCIQFKESKIFPQ